MVFGKQERKRHSVRAILAVGALAAIGAVTVVNGAKRITRGMLGRVKGMFKKESSVCSLDDGECD